MFRAIVFFGLTTAAFGKPQLDVLVNAAGKFFGYDPATTRSAPKRSITGGFDQRRLSTGSGTTVAAMTEKLRALNIILELSVAA